MEAKQRPDFGGGSSVTVFREVQHFRAVPWIALVLLFMAGMLVFLGYQTAGYPEKNPSRLPFIFPAVMVSLLFLLLFTLKLEVEVFPRTMRYRFFPLLPFWRELELSSIESAQAVTYRPILEFGGWGIRHGRGMWAYTVSGNRGVIVKIRGGRTFLIGSRMAEELQRSLALT